VWSLGINFGAICVVVCPPKVPGKKNLRPPLVHSNSHTQNPPSSRVWQEPWMCMQRPPRGDGARGWAGRVGKDDSRRGQRGVGIGLRPPDGGLGTDVGEWMARGPLGRGLWPEWPFEVVIWEDTKTPSLLHEHPFLTALRTPPPFSACTGGGGLCRGGGF